MKNFFKKFQNYSFWVALSGAVVILLNALGRAFGFSIENEIIENVVLSIAGVLVVLGIVSGAGDNEESDDEIEENFDANDKENDVENDEE